MKLLDISHAVPYCSLSDLGRSLISSQVVPRSSSTDLTKSDGLQLPKRLLCPSCCSVSARNTGRNIEIFLPRFRSWSKLLQYAPCSFLLYFCTPPDAGISRRPMANGNGLSKFPL